MRFQQGEGAIFEYYVPQNFIFRVDRIYPADLAAPQNAAEGSPELGGHQTVQHRVDGAVTRVMI